MLHVVENHNKGTAYGISSAMEREEFTAFLFELRKALESIVPRRNPGRIHRISVCEISHGEVGQGSIGIAVDCEIVPDLSDSRETSETLFVSWRSKGGVPYLCQY